MNLENIGKDCPCYEVDCSDIMFDISEFCGLPPNNGKLTIQVNGSKVGDFSANQQEDEIINITTPTNQDIENAVAGEALLRKQADDTLQSNINAEELARQRADRDIQAVLDGESLARVNEDRNLQSQIDAIASKSDVVDVVGTYAELQAYDTSKLNDNDVIKVLDDSTHNDSMTYYRWNKTTQTWSYIGQESPYYSKSQMDTILATKQDNLTAGTGITLNGSTISADTTVLAEKSELSNYAEKDNTYTKTEVDDLVEPKLSVDVVEQLPVQGEESKLYLTPKNYTTGSASGNPITIELGEDTGQISDAQLDGDTFQKTYTGSNLYMAKPYSNTTQQGIKTTIKEGYIFECYGTSTTTYSNIADWTNVNLPAGTYTICIDGTLTHNITMRLSFDPGNQDVVIAPGNTSTTFTVSSPIVAMRLFIETNGSGQLIDETIKINIVAGSTPTTVFEPYVGGVPAPNPDYPQPIQTVTGLQTVEVYGKNLFDIDNYSSAVLRDGGSAVSITKENSTTLKLTNLISQGSNFCGIPIPNSDSLLGKSVTISGTVELGTGVSDARVAVYAGTSTSVSTAIASNTISASGSFTLAANIPASYPSSTNLIHFVIYGSGNNSPAVNSTVVYSNLQMEIGTETAYAPYSKHTNEINLGKNLFDKDNAIIYALNPASAGSALSHLTNACSTFIPVTAGDTFTVSSTNRSLLDTYASVYFISGTPDTATTWIARTQFGQNSSVTVTAPAGATYLGLYFLYSSNQTTIANAKATIQIESGSTATTYAPYMTPIKLCKLGTYQDYIYKSGSDWKVHKAIGKTTYDGSNDEIWTKSNSTANQLFIGRADGMSKNNSVTVVAKSDKFTYIDRAIIYAQSEIGFTTQTTGDNYAAIRIGLGLDSTVNTVALFRAYLSENITTVYYPLATPTDTTITDQTLISQLEAVRTATLQSSNTITNTATGTSLAGDLELSYYEYDPTNRYDKWIWLDINDAYEKLGS